jgi:hypothetical protein
MLTRERIETTQRMAYAGSANRRRVPPIMHWIDASEAASRRQKTMFNEKTGS